MLGLLEQGEPATPYDLKQLAQLSTNNFWSVPHTQLYTECARLAAEGLLDERQEQTGRRRRIYRLTARGREAAARLARRAGDRALRTARRSTLKLFFGGDPARSRRRSCRRTRQRLAEYEELRKGIDALPQGSGWRWSAASATSASSSASGRACWRRRPARLGLLAEQVLLERAQQRAAPGPSSSVM